ncbi:MAG: hypothetical protein JSU03_09870 [Bacteroidetes bacterium]|nr:hypothetical protein [Bacteroidota bacterium]
MVKNKLRQIYNDAVECPISFYYICKTMMPDYPHKIFADRRMNYSLLMNALAMDSENGAVIC